jgi:hypothetical protein
MATAERGETCADRGEGEHLVLRERRHLQLVATADNVAKGRRKFVVQLEDLRAICIGEAGRVHKVEDGCDCLCDDAARRMREKLFCDVVPKSAVCLQKKIS